MTAKIIRTAHGAGASTLLRAEESPLDEKAPLNAQDAERGCAVAARVGRPFARGNSAGSLRGSALTRAKENPNAPEEQRKVDRKAARLSAARQRELRIAHGGAKLSTPVCTEVVAWARCIAWSDHYFRNGDPKAGALFAEKASAHGLRAAGFAEREGAARPVGDEVPPGFEEVDDE